MKHWNPHSTPLSNTQRSAGEERQIAHQRSKQRERQQDRDDRQDDVDAVADQIATAIIQIQQAELKDRLERLAEANAAALMENTEQLDAVRERISNLLEQAFVLPDGRRVFKTEDGTRVIDEFGQEVPPDLVHPDQIDDVSPRWEEYHGERAREGALERERERLLQEQQQIDQAHDNLDNGTLEPSDLDTLEADLGPAEPQDTPTQVSRYQLNPTKTPAPGT